MKMRSQMHEPTRSSFSVIQPLLPKSHWMSRGWRPARRYQ